jgi:AdoMet-dependent heme synthase
MSITSPFEFFLQLHLTERCNLRCKHCYQKENTPAEMSLPEIKALIDEVSDMFQVWKETYNINVASSFNITGGEPFLRQDILSVLEMLREKGFDTYLLSNGTLISREKAEVLAVLGIKGVQISIEGPEEIHNDIRGLDSYSSSLKGIQNLLNAGIEVAINTTLSGINAPYFMDVIALASSLGVRKVGFSRLVPSGKGEALLNQMLTRKALEDLYREILSLSSSNLQIVTGDPVASQLRSPSVETTHALVPSGGCAAGISGLTILPDGTVTPCRRLPVSIGNINKDPLREIWATSKVLSALRNRSAYTGKCGTCERWSLCRGCRAIAYAYSGTTGSASYLAEDPQCFLEQNDSRPRSARHRTSSL